MTGRKWTYFILICTAALLLMTVLPGAASDLKEITVQYSAPDNNELQITVEFCDDWLLRPDNVYNHDLMQASFAMAISAYRDRTHDLSQKDFNILDFLEQAGFTEPMSNDYHLTPSIETIATVIAHKKVGNTTIIAAAVSGGGYTNEWQSNLSLSDGERAGGFNIAAQKVLSRIREYIRVNGLSGDLHLWIAGYSRAAAVSNITAADATDSNLFESVYAYTFATPRTTKDPDPGRYTNIFNIINPFDSVPMAPFPEWGFTRYGKDLFLPGQETDSSYSAKKPAADAVFARFKGGSLPYNPQINAQIHTIMDFLLFFINSNESYKDTFQTGVVSMMRNRSPKVLLQDILNRVSQLPDITAYQIGEFGEMMDYIMQVCYNMMRAVVFHAEDLQWIEGSSAKENMMHEHYDEVYRSWLFSTDDPEALFDDDPSYVHYTVTGDVDIDIFDENDAFVFRIDREGNIIRDLSGFRDQDLYHTLSPTVLCGFRGENKTVVYFPTDQTFNVLINSHKDQQIVQSYVKYSADELRADVQYITDETVNEGNFYIGLVDPALFEEFTEEELQQFGFRMVEPWSQYVVYSPSAVMRLENIETFHPSPRTFISFAGLIALLLIYIALRATLATGKGIVRGVKKVRSTIIERQSRRSAENEGTIEEAASDPELPAAEDNSEDNTPEGEAIPSQDTAKDEQNENQ